MEESGRIIITGGSGKAGKYVASHLIDKGYRVLNVDLINYEQKKLDYLFLDITDSGQVFNVFSSHFNKFELRKQQSPSKIDAIVHLAAIPRILVKPDNETFRINVLGTYNVIEASIKLGIKKIIFASSETVYGFCFSHGNPIPTKLPINEDYPLSPMDSYAISKVVNEETAKGFQRRSGIDIYGLRIGNVFEPDDYKKFKDFAKNPELRLPNLFNYIDARDLAQAVELCIEKNELGYEVFNVSNDNNSVNLKNSEIIKRFYENLKIYDDLEEHECLFSNKKIRNMLGFKPNYNWKF